MSAVASVIAETGGFSLSHPVNLVHYGGTKSSTRAIISKLPQTPSQLMGSFSKSGWIAWVLIEPKRRPVEFLTSAASGRRWRVLSQEDRTSPPTDSTGKRTNFLQLIDA